MLVYFGAMSQTASVRYVRIQQNGTGSDHLMQLAEVRAIETSTGTNVALNKTITSFSNNPSHPDANFVDGNVNNFGLSQNAGTAEFIEIDLGAAYILDKIEIVNRSDSHWFRAENLQLVLKDYAGIVSYSTPIDAYQGQNSGYTTSWNVTSDGEALNYDGANSYIEMPSALSIGGGDMSFECFIKVPTVGTGGLSSGERVGCVVGNFGSNNNSINFEIHSAGQLRLYWNQGQINEFGTTDLRDDTWHHIAYVRNVTDNKWYVYIDGVLEFTHNSAGSNITINNAFRIGNDYRSGGLPYHGNLDEVRFWSKALTQSEIQTNLVCEISGSETGLEAYYRLNTGRDGSDNTGLTWAEDFTSNNYFGKLTGFSMSGSSSNWVEPGGLICVTANISGSTVGCDTLHLTASGGDTYLWSTGDTIAQIVVDSSATYFVTVTNSSGNTATASHTVTISTSPTASISGNATACDSTTLTVTGAGTYLWSSGDTTTQVNYTANGTYFVTVMNASGCSAVDSLVVTINTSPSASISIDSSNCGVVILTASGGTSYLWSNGDTSAQVNLTTSGTYTVTVTSSGGCTDSQSQAIVIGSNTTYYLDADGDGYGDKSTSVTLCGQPQPAGYVENDGDCDDANGQIHPGAPEICDNIDNNCNGILTEGNCPGNEGEISDFCASVSSNNVLSGTGSFNYGSISNGLNAVSRVSATVGQPLVGTAFEPNLNLAFGFWSRFLIAPSAPAVLGSEGEFPDRNQIKWEADPLSPAATSGFNIYRNGALLASVNPEVRSFLDFNVIAGEFYTYEVAGINDFGEGYKGSALAFLNPNGVVTGKIETFTGNPVPNAVVTLTPTIGTALAFDGIGSSFVEYDTLFPRAAFTVSCWVKIGNNNDAAGIIDLGSNIGKNWWLHTQTSGNPKGVTFGIGRDTNDVTELSYEFPVDEADEWHYVAASFSGAALLLYVDGELIETAVADIESDSSILFFGQRPEATGYYTGKLDEVRFFDKQLPQTEIQMLMNKTANSKTPGLVSYWKFDEGIGAKAFNITDNKFTTYHCGTAWTSDKPLVVNAGITDETGFYKIEGINYSSGTTFKAIPSKEFYLNQSLEFNGVNESYADLTDFDLKDTAAITVTLKAFDFSGNQAILSKADAGGNNQFVLCLNAGNVDLILNGQSHTFGALEMGFHHLAVNLFQDGSSLEAVVYKNGNLLGSHAFTGVATDWTGLPWKLGTKTDGMSGQVDFFTGLIDEVVFFDTLLTLPEIQEYSNVGTDINNLFLASIFNLNEGTNTKIGDTGPAFTGNGTIHGATWSTVTANIETLAHEFIPGSRLVTLNPSNTGVDKIDFTDQSTIPVSGYVRFEGTKCFQQRAEILVNGQSHVPQIFTDVEGKFVVDLEPGESVILMPKFEDHTFSPAFWELNNLSTPVSGILFQNQVKRKVVGQMAGGHCRKSVIPNSSIVQVKVATLDGCFEKVLDLEGDGKFTFANVPPDSVTVAVIQHSNPVIYNYFQNLGGATLDLRMKDDTTDFIYFSPPEVELTPLDTNQCGDPMLNMLQTAKTTVKVFESYDGGSCYLDTALITINNDIAHLDQFDTLMTEGELLHRFRVEEPNIVAPYLKTLQVTAEAHDEFATQTLSAVVLGRRPRQTTFTSTAPELPTLILRDPPGDGSYSYMESGETTCQNWSFEVEDALNTGGHITAHLGPDIETTMGTPFFATSLAVDVTADLGVSFEANTTSYSSNEMETCLTTSKTISTGDNDLIVGSSMGGDVYMGGAMNFIFGITDELLYDTLNCSFYLDKGLYVFPEGFNTTFIYTESHIKSIVIPNLLTIGDTTSANRWEEIIDLNTQLKNEAVFSKNLSFDSGITYEESETSEVTKTVTNSFTLELGAGFAAEFGVTVNGLGVTGGVNMDWSTTSTSTSSTTTSTTRTVGYTLADDDFFDNFTVNVKKDKAYGTPVFDLVSGQSSCPHEPNTQHREEVNIVADAQVAVNVPMNDVATFDLTLGNVAPSGDIGFYNIELVPESNPDAAEVSMNGVSLNFPQQYQILPNEGQTFTMSVGRGPTEFEYDSLRVALYSECEFEHAANLGIPRAGIDEKFYKELAFDVHFLEPCSEVDVGFPLEGWVLVPADGDILNITVNDYDINDPDLELIRVQYRRTNGDGAWINIEELPKDSLGSVFTIVPWDTQGLQDALYQIRAVTQCFGAQNPGISHLIDGKIERTAPEIFGIPEPADGVLEADDEISITFSEPIRCDLIIQADVFSNNNVGLYNTTTGALVDAIITCNEDKIIIVPNVPNHFIENELLRVEVDSIQDLAGNFFDHEDWEFVVDRNPLKWKSNNLTETKFEDEFKTVLKEIVNVGGATQGYEITGIPSWVNVFPTTGNLAAGEQQFITFEFDSSMVVNEFVDTITMEGSQGDEPLPINFRNLCRSPEWEINPALYTYSMNFTLELNIEGTVSTDKQDIVAAFIDGQLRGFAYVQYVAALDKYEAFLTVYSNSFDTGTVEFQIWNASECLLYGDIIETFTFTADDLVGEPNNPQVIQTNNLLLRDIPLHQGWNWISFNLSFPNTTLDSALASLDYPQNDLIKSQTAFANYINGSGWIGSLSDVNNTSMFQFLADKRDTINMVGNPIDLSTTSITVSSGWNWISYLPLEPLEVDTALASLSPSNGDIIKNQTAFAQYVTGFGWLGNLTYMQAPEGYLLKLASGGNITYPTSSFTGGNADDRNETEGNHSPWTVNPMLYEHNMTIIGMLSDEGLNITSEQQTIGAFVGEEVRGIADAMYVESLGTWYFFLTLYANQSGDLLKFKLYDDATGEMVDLNEEMFFLIDAHLGSVEEPEPFTLSISSETEETTALSNQFLVQPNPFRDETRIVFYSKGETAQLVITDALGRVVEYEEIPPAGNWGNYNWKNEGLAPGVYFIKLKLGEKMLSKKVVKQ